MTIEIAPSFTAPASAGPNINEHATVETVRTVNSRADRGGMISSPRIAANCGRHPYAIATFKAARPPSPVEPVSIEMLLCWVCIAASRLDEKKPAEAGYVKEMPTVGGCE
ncbi:hypothetical protein D3C86_1834410 [compost metagenome]